MVYTSLKNEHRDILKRSLLSKVSRRKIITTVAGKCKQLRKHQT